MPPAVLVLGGSGFLGQYVIEELTRDGEYNVVVVCNDGNNSFSPPSNASSSVVECVPGNLASGEGFLEAFAAADALGRRGDTDAAAGTGLAAVVNCAAVSSPAECQRDPERSRAVNVPSRLVEALLAFEAANYSPSSGPETRPPPPPPPPLLVHLSTDQIYSGKRELDVSGEAEAGEEDFYVDREADPDAETGERPTKSLWREDEAESKVPDDDGRSEGSDNHRHHQPQQQQQQQQSQRRGLLDPDAPAVRPLNAYAKQKVQAELFMGGSCPRSVCLRSSVMYGRLPRNKAAVRGMRFLQFCDEALERSAAAAAAGEEEVTSASFFDDEFRSFVAVTDVAKAVVACVRRWGRNGDEAPPCAINVGGPERLSRAQFARLVAGARGLDPALVNAVPSASVERAVPSPRDISMRVERLEGLLGVKPLSVAEALKDMPPEEEV